MILTTGYHPRNVVALLLLMIALLLSANTSTAHTSINCGNVSRISSTTFDTYFVNDYTAELADCPIPLSSSISIGLGDVYVENKGTGIPFIVFIRNVTLEQPLYMDTEGMTALDTHVYPMAIYISNVRFIETSGIRINSSLVPAMFNLSVTGSTFLAADTTPILFMMQSTSIGSSSMITIAHNTFVPDACDITLNGVIRFVNGLVVKPMASIQVVNNTIPKQCFTALVDVSGEFMFNVNSVLNISGNNIFISISYEVPDASGTILLVTDSGVFQGTVTISDNTAILLFQSRTHLALLYGVLTISGNQGSIISGRNALVPAQIAVNFAKVVVFHFNSELHILNNSIVHNPFPCFTSMALTQPPLYSLLYVPDGYLNKDHYHIVISFNSVELPVCADLGASVGLTVARATLGPWVTLHLNSTSTAASRDDGLVVISHNIVSGTRDPTSSTIMFTVYTEVMNEATSNIFVDVSNNTFDVVTAVGLTYGSDQRAVDNCIVASLFAVKGYGHFNVANNTFKPKKFIQCDVDAQYYPTTILKIYTLSQATLLTVSSKPVYFTNNVLVESHVFSSFVEIVSYISTNRDPIPQLYISDNIHENSVFDAVRNPSLFIVTVDGGVPKSDVFAVEIRATRNTMRNLSSFFRFMEVRVNPTDASDTSPAWVGLTSNLFDTAGEAIVVAQSFGDSELSVFFCENDISSSLQSHAVGEVKVTYCPCAIPSILPITNNASNFYYYSGCSLPRLSDTDLKAGGDVVIDVSLFLDQVSAGSTTPVSVTLHSIPTSTSGSIVIEGLTNDTAAAGRVSQGPLSFYLYSSHFSRNVAFNATTPTGSKFLGNAPRQALIVRNILPIDSVISVFACTFSIEEYMSQGGNNLVLGGGAISFLLFQNFQLSGTLARVTIANSYLEAIAYVTQDSTEALLADNTISRTYTTTTIESAYLANGATFSIESCKDILNAFMTSKVGTSSLNPCIVSDRHNSKVILTVMSLLVLRQSSSVGSDISMSGSTAPLPSTKGLTPSSSSSSSSTSSSSAPFPLLPPSSSLPTLEERPGLFLTSGATVTILNSKITATETWLPGQYWRTIDKFVLIRAVYMFVDALVLDTSSQLILSKNTVIINSVKLGVARAHDCGTVYWETTYPTKATTTSLKIIITGAFLDSILLFIGGLVVNTSSQVLLNQNAIISSTQQIAYTQTIANKNYTAVQETALGILRMYNASLSTNSSIVFTGNAAQISGTFFGVFTTSILLIGGDGSTADISMLSNTVDFIMNAPILKYITQVNVVLLGGFNINVTYNTTIELLGNNITFADLEERSGGVSLRLMFVDKVGGSGGRIGIMNTRVRGVANTVLLTRIRTLELLDVVIPPTTITTTSSPTTSSSLELDILSNSIEVMLAAGDGGASDRTSCLPPNIDTLLTSEFNVDPGKNGYPTLLSLFLQDINLHYDKRTALHIRLLNNDVSMKGMGCNNRVGGVMYLMVDDTSGNGITQAGVIHVVVTNNTMIATDGSVVADSFIIIITPVIVSAADNTSPIFVVSNNTLSVAGAAVPSMVHFSLNTTRINVQQASYPTNYQEGIVNLLKMTDNTATISQRSTVWTSSLFGMSDTLPFQTVVPLTKPTLDVTVRGNTIFSTTAAGLNSNPSAVLGRSYGSVPGKCFGPTFVSIIRVCDTWLNDTYGSNASVMPLINASTFEADVLLCGSTPTHTAPRTPTITLLPPHTPTKTSATPTPAGTSSATRPHTSTNTLVHSPTVTPSHTKTVPIPIVPIDWSPCTAINNTRVAGAVTNVVTEGGSSEGCLPVFRVPHTVWGGGNSFDVEFNIRVVRGAGSVRINTTNFTGLSVSGSSDVRVSYSGRGQEQMSTLHGATVVVVPVRLSVRFTGQKKLGALGRIVMDASGVIGWTDNGFGMYYKRAVTTTTTTTAPPPPASTTTTPPPTTTISMPPTTTTATTTTPPTTSTPTTSTTTIPTSVTTASASTIAPTTTMTTTTPTTTDGSIVVLPASLNTETFPAKPITTTSAHRGFAAMTDDTPTMSFAMELDASEVSEFTKVTQTVSEAVVGGGGALTANPSGVVRAGMISAIANMLRCGEVDLEEPLPWMNNVFLLKFGADEGAYHRGSLVSGLIVVCIGLALCGIVIVATHLGMNVGWVGAAAGIHFPGVMVASVSLAMEGWLPSSVTLLSKPNAVGGDIAWGVVFLLVSIAYCLHVLYTAGYNLGVETVDVVDDDAEERAKRGTFRRVADYLLEPTMEIRPRAQRVVEGRWWIDLYHPYGSDMRFIPYKGLELALGGVVNITEGFVAEQFGGCVAKVSIALLSVACVGVLIIVYRPFATRVGAVMGVLVTFLMFVACAMGLANLWLVRDDLSEAADGMLSAAALAVTLQMLSEILGIVLGARKSLEVFAKKMRERAARGLWVARARAGTTRLKSISEVEHNDHDDSGHGDVHDDVSKSAPLLDNTTQDPYPEATPRGVPDITHHPTTTTTTYMRDLALDDDGDTTEMEDVGLYPRGDAEEGSYYDDAEEGEYNSEEDDDDEETLSPAQLKLLRELGQIRSAMANHDSSSDLGEYDYDDESSDDILLPPPSSPLPPTPPATVPNPHRIVWSHRR